MDARSIADDELGADPIGVYTSTEMREAARRRAKERGVRITLEAGDARSLPFGERLSK